MASSYKVVTALSTETFKALDIKGRGKNKNNTILMGSYVKLLGETKDGWAKVKAFGTEGWIKIADLGETPDFKCYYVDVGQGDAALIEVGNDKQGDKKDGLKILIDGGPSDNLSRYLSKWQYKYYFDINQKVHFDYLFISHFDKDHYNGLIDIINDEHYTFGAIYHNGIAKFNKEKSTYPAEYNTELGKKTKQGKEYYLQTQFDTLEELNALKNKGGMIDLMENFVTAINNAQKQGRLGLFKRLHSDDAISAITINDQPFKIDVIGPVLNRNDGNLVYKYFEDEAHTINGHSLVLKITYGLRSFLFGGDLNIPSEEHLLKHYGKNNNPFEVDVAKSCHHGASEFTVDFMGKVNPLATVISSGDNESYAHPRADAIGCAGKYSRSIRPLVFSTELARSTNVNTDEIKYGMINLRCDGKDIVMAQMKEVISNGNVWDLYRLTD